MKKKHLVLLIVLLLNSLTSKTTAQEKEFIEFEKHQTENTEKESVEFLKHTVEPIEKQNIEFKKHLHVTEEKEKTEFQKFVYEKPAPKVLKDFPKLKSEKIDKQIISNPNNLAANDSINNSVFDNFKIPVRENINESFLLFDGWKTDPNTYTFRCKNEKRVRLTFWYSKLSANEEMEGSEFINVTNTIDDCSESDRMYEHQAPASPQIIRKKVKIEETEKPKDEKVKTKEPKKKKFNAWKGLKK